MDGENNGKPYEQMDDLGVFPYFWKHPFGHKFSLHLLIRIQKRLQFVQCTDSFLVNILELEGVKIKRRCENVFVFYPPYIYGKSLVVPYTLSPFIYLFIYF